MGDENMWFRAIDLEDFILRRLCSEFTAVATEDRDSAILVLNHLRTGFGFDLDLAIASWDCEHTEKYKSDANHEQNRQSFVSLGGENFAREMMEKSKARDSKKLDRPDFSQSYELSVLKPLERLLVLPED